MNPMNGGPHWNVSLGGCASIGFPTACLPVLIGSIIGGLCQLSSVSQRSFVVRPSKMILPIVMVGGSDFQMIAPPEPAGVPLPVPEAGWLCLFADRVMVISVGLKSNGATPKDELGSMQRSVAGMSAPIAVATPTATPAAAPT